MLLLFGKLVIFLGLTLYISYALGARIISLLKFDEIDYYFVTPIGFYALIGIFQLCIYPVQLFHWNAEILKYILIILYFVIGMTCSKFIKNLKYIRIQPLLIVIGLTFVAVGLLYFCNNAYYLVGENASGFEFLLDDAFYYIRTVAVNSIDINPVNLVEPISGLIGDRVSVLYAFTGILHFYGVIANLFKVDAIVVVFWFSYILNAIMAFMLALNIYRLVKGNVYIKVLAPSLIIGVFLIGFSFVNAFEPVYLRSNAIVFLLIFYLFKYFETHLDKWLIIYVILTFGTLACQSTYLFLSAILLIAVMCVDCIVYKTFDVLKLSLIGLPTIVYGLAYIFYVSDIYITMIVLVIILLINIIFLFYKQFSKPLIPLVVLAIIFVVMVTFGFTQSYSVYNITESFDYFYKYFNPIEIVRAPIISNKFDIINKLMIPLFFLMPIIMLFKWKKLKNDAKIYVVMSLVIIILFYNPLVMPFVSTFLTGIVYHRIENILLNLFFYVLLINIISKYISFFPIVCLISLLTFIPNLFIQTIENIDNFYMYHKTVDPFYKIDREIIKMSTFIDGYFDEAPTILVPRKIYNLRLINNWYIASDLNPSWVEMYNLNYLFEYEKLNKNMKVQCYLELPIDYFTNHFYYYDEENVPDIQQILIESNANVFIIKKWVAEDNEHTGLYLRLDEIANVIYQTDEYLMYEIKNSYLEN